MQGILGILLMNRVGILFVDLCSRYCSLGVANPWFTAEIGMKNLFRKDTKSCICVFWMKLHSQLYICIVKSAVSDRINFHWPSGFQSCFPFIDIWEDYPTGQAKYVGWKLPTAAFPEAKHRLIMFHFPWFKSLDCCRWFFSNVSKWDWWNLSCLAWFRSWLWLHLYLWPTCILQCWFPCSPETCIHLLRQTIVTWTNVKSWLIGGNLKSRCLILYTSGWWW